MDVGQEGKGEAGEVRRALREAASMCSVLVHSHNVRVGGSVLQGACCTNCPLSKVIPRQRITYRRWSLILEWIFEKQGVKIDLTRVVQGPVSGFC